MKSKKELIKEIAIKCVCAGFPARLEWFDKYQSGMENGSDGVNDHELLCIMICNFKDDALLALAQAIEINKLFDIVFEKKDQKLSKYIREFLDVDGRDDYSVDEYFTNELNNDDSVKEKNDKV